jgi:hypothetical protein
MQPSKPFNRDGAKAAGYSDEEIDAYLAKREAASQSKAIAQPAAQPAAQRPKPAQFGKGLARSAAQGVTFGFGEEIEAKLPFMRESGESEEQALKRIRGEMEQYREAYPKTAIASEIGGGLLTGGVGGVRAAGATAARAGLRQALKRGVGAAARSATVSGALSGAGAAEGDAMTRLGGAVVGGALGGVTGGVLGKAGQAAATRLARGGRAADAGVTMLEQQLREAGQTPAQFQTAASRMAQTAPEARVADVLGEQGVRRARAIAGIGGEAGERITRTMEGRYAGRPERLQEALTRTTGRQAENIFSSIDDIVEQRAKDAESLYGAVRQQPAVQDATLEAFVEKRPSMRDAFKKAEALAAEEGVVLQYMDTPTGPVPLRTPAFLDYAKRALDDRLYRGKMPGEGGLGLTERRAIANTRAEYLQMLDTMIPGYKEARSVFAGHTALKNALEDGAEAATKRLDPRDVTRTVADLTESEGEMFQRGYLDGLRNKVDAGQLRPAEIRTPKFGKMLDAVFGGQGQQVREALLADVQLMENAAQVVRGSRTAPLAADMAREAASGTPVTTALRAALSPREVGVRLLGGAEERLRGGLTAGARGQRANVLMQEASQIGPLMSRLAQEERARRIGRGVGTATRMAAGGTAARQGINTLFNTGNREY